MFRPRRGGRPGLESLADEVLQPFRSPHAIRRDILAQEATALNYFKTAVSDVPTRCVFIGAIALLPRRLILGGSASLCCAWRLKGAGLSCRLGHLHAE